MSKISLFTLVHVLDLRKLRILIDKHEAGLESDVLALSYCFLLSLFPSSLLFLQVDNRPCSRSPSTCFPYATEAASFLRAVMLLKPTSFPILPELKAIIGIRGVREEIGSREEETPKKEVKSRLTCPVSRTQTHTRASSFEFHPNKTL